MSSTAVVVFASEQVWPNLQCLEWFAKSQGLTHVFIYHTADERRSRVPARNLSAFLKQQHPTLSVTLPPDGCDMEPRAVCRQLRAWRDRVSGPDRWVIHATGGTKLMFAGALSAMLKDQWEVIYLEITGGWFRLSANSSGEIQAHSLPPDQGIPSDILDNCRVLDLIRTQYPADHGVIWSDEPVRSLDIAQIGRVLELAQASDWDWKAAWRKVTGEDSASGGFAFERFIAATVRFMGFSEQKVGLNISVKNEATGMAQQEMDVAVHHEGRLTIIDCKLVDEKAENDESFVTHLRAAHDTVRALGGLKASCLFLRPNRPLNEAERAMGQALNIRILDRDACQRLFSTLAQELHVPILDDLRDLETRRFPRLGSPRPFAVSAPPAVQRWSDLSDGGENSHVLDLARLRAQYENFDERIRGQWLAVALSAPFWTLLFRSENTTDLQRRLTSALEGIATVCALEKSRNGDSCIALLRVNNLIRFKEWMAARQGCPVLESTAADLAPKPSCPAPAGTKPIATRGYRPPPRPTWGDPARS